MCHGHYRLRNRHGQRCTLGFGLDNRLEEISSSRAAMNTGIASATRPRVVSALGRGQINSRPVSVSVKRRTITNLGLDRGENWEMSRVADHSCLPPARGRRRASSIRVCFGVRAKLALREQTCTLVTSPSGTSCPVSSDADAASAFRLTACRCGAAITALGLRLNTQRYDRHFPSRNRFWRGSNSVNDSSARGGSGVDSPRWTLRDHDVRGGRGAEVSGSAAGSQSSSNCTIRLSREGGSLLSR